MALYALGDLHLSFQVHKPMTPFGRVWREHERKIEKYVNRIVKPEDTLVLTGDHSWGRKLAECREDLEFIERLPGRKILLRGKSRHVLGRQEDGASQPGVCRKAVFPAE